MVKSILKIKYKNLETGKIRTIQRSSYKIEDLESIQEDMNKYDHLQIISSKIKDNRNLSVEEELKLTRKKLGINYLPLYNNKMEKKKEGCGQHCRVSQISKRIFICGESLLDGEPFLCDDCINKDKVEEVLK